MKDLKAMMGKMDESKGSMEKDAKLSVLKQLRQMAAEMSGADVKSGMEGLKKVTVAAPDSEGLEHGLDKAKDLLEGSEMEESDDSELPDDEMMEEESEEMSPEEMKAKIAELKAMLAAR